MVLLLLLQEVLLFDQLSSLATSSCASSLLCVSTQTKLIHSADAAKTHFTRKRFLPSGSVSCSFGVISIYKILQHKRIRDTI